MSRGVACSLNCYRLLLHVYPAPLRWWGSQEMLQDFRERCEEEQRRRGVLGLILLWLEIVADAAIEAPQEHYRMLLHELRYAIRTLRKSPGFTSAAVICLALGLGGSTAVFSIVNAVLLKPLPYRDSRRLVRVYTEFPNFPNGGLHRFAADPPEFHELQSRKDAWDRLEAWAGAGVSLSGSGEPLSLNATFVTGGLFSMLGATPRLGRPITPADDDPGLAPNVVISDGLWRRAFAGDRNAIGKEVWLDGGKARIVGVMPKDFDFPPGASLPTDAWIPMQLTQQQLTQGQGGHFLSLIAHLRPEMSMAQAQQRMQTIINSMGERSSPKYHTIDPKQHPLSMYSFQDETIGNARTAMRMLLGAVAFFLLIACVNVANLLLARSDSRRREVAVRKAIGAAAPHLVRQFLVEGLTLSCAGALLGGVLAWAGVKLVAVTNAGTIPRIREAGLDANVLLFAVIATIVTGIAFGMAPMFQAFSQPVSEALKGASGRSSGSVRANRFRAALVTAELSLALVLLIGSGLLVRAFWRLQQVNPGIRPEGLLTAQLSLTSSVYTNDAKKLQQFWISLNEKLAAIPGVESATIASGLPPQRFAVQNDTFIEHFVPRRGGPIQNVAFYQGVGDRFFETLGTRLVEGRYFDQRDGDGAPLTVMVNHTMAATFWPGERAVGKRIRPGGTKEWMTVIGVVADLKNAGLDQPVGTEIFLPARQGNPTAAPYAIVKTSMSDPRALANAVTAAVHALDPAVPVSRVRTMNEVLSLSESRPKFLAMVLTAFSSLALILSAFGIYGVVSYSVSRRTPEFGIRLALGAQTADILRMVMREGFILAVTGVIAGCAGAVFMTRALEELLFEVSRFDATTFAATAAIMSMVTLFACWVPARRATAVDPLKALRYE
jgi:putative ABC transport system permease protein